MNAEQTLDAIREALKREVRAAAPVQDDGPGSAELGPSFTDEASGVDVSPTCGPDFPVVVMQLNAEQGYLFGPRWFRTETDAGKFVYHNKVPCFVTGRAWSTFPTEGVLPPFTAVEHVSPDPEPDSPTED